jgi:cytochrome c oxidase subunit 2
MSGFIMRFSSLVIQVALLAVFCVVACTRRSQQESLNNPGISADIKADVLETSAASDVVPPPRPVQLVAVPGDPRDASEVYAIAKENGSDWVFQHQSGFRELNKLHLSVNRGVQMITISEKDAPQWKLVPGLSIDAPVLADLGFAEKIRLRIPSFGLEVNAVGGTYRRSNVVVPTSMGEFNLWCDQHLIGKVHVVEPSAYLNIMEGRSESWKPSAGQHLFERLQCNSCHTGSKGSRGPSLVGLFGSRIPLTDGRGVIADEDYIMESILNPKAKVHEGWEPIMPSFKGQISTEQLAELVRYIKNIR